MKGRYFLALPHVAEGVNTVSRFPQEEGERDRERGRERQRERDRGDGG